MIIQYHSHEILLEEFLKPMGISQNKVVRDIRVPPRRINEYMEICAHC